MMLDPQKRDKFSFLTYLPEDQKVQANAMYLRGLLSVYEFKAGAASSTANNAHCEAGAGAAAWVSPQPRSLKKAQHTVLAHGGGAGGTFAICSWVCATAAVRHRGC